MRKLEKVGCWVRSSVVRSAASLTPEQAENDPSELPSSGIETGTASEVKRERTQ
jgi:hypothetical protein